MAKEKSALSRKIDNICRVVFLTEEGRPKSALLIYSFSLALLFIVIYAVGYMFMIDGIENLFAASPVWVRNVLEYSIPGLLCSIPCVLLSFAFRKNMNMVPVAYVWIDVLIVLSFLTMAVTVDFSDWAMEYGFFLVVIGIPLLVSGFCGTLGSYMLYNKRQRSNLEQNSRDLSKR